MKGLSVLKFFWKPDGNEKKFWLNISQGSTCELFSDFSLNFFPEIWVTLFGQGLSASAAYPLVFTVCTVI